MLITMLDVRFRKVETKVLIPAYNCLCAKCVPAWIRIKNFVLVKIWETVFISFNVRSWGTSTLEKIIFTFPNPVRWHKASAPNRAWTIFLRKVFENSFRVTLRWKKNLDSFFTSVHQQSNVSLSCSAAFWRFWKISASFGNFSFSKWNYTEHSFALWGKNV